MIMKAQPSRRFMVKKAEMQADAGRNQNVTQSYDFS